MRRAGAEIWAHCLIPNRVHVIVVPGDEDALRRTFADDHRRYTGYVNARLLVADHLWQGRFGSVVMYEEHLGHAVRYVSLNPVRANRCTPSRSRGRGTGRDRELPRICPAGMTRW